jgi:hypothetical protein
VLRALRMLSLAGLLAVGVLSAPSAVAGAAPGGGVTAMSCGTITTGAVFGGYRARMICEGKQLDGFGTTAGAAQTNVNNLHQAALDTGVYCYTNPVPQGVSGGYRVISSCNNKRIDSFGTTLSDVGNNLQGLVYVAGSGVFCGYTTLEVPTGGYRLRMSCNNTAVDAHGSTLTDAASHSVAMAGLAGSYGVFCLYNTYSTIGGGYRIAMACNNRAVAGAGTTLTDAANNVYNFAYLFALTGRYCGGAGWENIPGGLRVTMLCYPTGGHRYGTGTSITQAANNAYINSW